MRLFVSLAVLGLAFAAMPAMAQQTTTQPQVVYTPMYNPSPNSYYQPGVGGSPVYNNGSAQPYAMNQMIAGKNAPSYNYNRSNAYTGFTNTGDPLAGADLANLTPEQSRYIEQQRLYRVQQEQQAFLQQQQAQLQQQQAWQQSQQQINTMQNLNQGYNPLAQQEQPRQRRVIYKERNNPLVTPQRLFNPDQ
jgi:hypothetical protein